MAEILLGRHGMSTANARDPAFGNEQAPLTPLGVEQSVAMGETFRSVHGIDPPHYSLPVLSSEFLRPQQTAAYAGFKQIHINPILNEGVIPPGMLGGREIVEKHAKEGWIPDDLKSRAERFLNLVQKGELEYQIFFTHGLFIASVVSELRPVDIPFDPKRGYIPGLASITKLII